MANYEDLNQGLIRVEVKAVKPAVDFTWAQDVLFGGPVIGTDQDYIDLKKEIGEIVVPEEAVKGLDPTRVNYGVSFDIQRVGSQYFFPEDILDLSSAKNRLFEEPLDQPWSTAERELRLAAKKKNAMAQGFRAKKEKMAIDCALTGKFTTKTEGEQVFPVKAALLSISGAQLIANPFKTLSDAATTLFKHGVILSRVVMNPNDASALTAGAAWQKLVDLRKAEVGKIDPQRVLPNGIVHVGTIVGIPSGDIEIQAYVGYGPDKAFYLPAGSAFLLPADPIGSMGYTGLLIKNGDVQDKVALKETFLVYSEAKGNLVTTKIQGQTAPAPLITAIDGYGVMTGIVTA